jgi:hypothetical protein
MIPKGYSEDTHQESWEKQADAFLKNETLTFTSITHFLPFERHALDILQKLRQVFAYFKSHWDENFQLCHHSLVGVKPFSYVF